jgi:16S rRNA (guanine527-N7)-methyltransferase
VDQRLESYLRELVRWGERTNLVGSLERSALEQHLSDSLAAAPHLPSGARVADLGSGAGLPGIPLAIAREDAAITLVEIRERRVHFLRHVVRTLGLACRVERVDLDEAAPDAPYDVALLRAVAPPVEAVPRARPWVRDGGEIWLWTREPAEALPWPVAGEIPIGAGRGSVLRIRACDVPRRTL